MVRKLKYMFSLMAVMHSTMNLRMWPTGLSYVRFRRLSMMLTGKSFLNPEPDASLKKSLRRFKNMN